ncbi:TPA: hypothetical protein ACH3X2_005708 [Trebouxia sp. C0005]
MGNNSSTPVTPQTIYKAASANNVQLLIEVLTKVPSNQLYQFLEPQDECGWTPLMVASAKGHTAAAHELLKAGAQVHHVSKEGRSTALHEAVLRSHGDLVDMLLRASANPFLENGSGLTPVDVAINNKQVAIVRRLEQGAAFAGWLSQKVTKYMGLGSEWNDRWCVVMPRFPSVAAPANQQLTRSLLVIYKGPDMTNPCCKVWLDGAKGIPVDDRPDRPPGCNLALHRNHAAPSGCYITGDPSIGYTLHFRATDASAAEVNKMRRFTDLCNAGASVIARGAQAVTLLAQPQTQGSLQAAARPRPSQANQASPQRPPAQPSPQPQPPSTHTGLSADEQVARRLQAEYDREMAAYLVDHPDDAAMRRMAGHAFNPCPQPSTNTAQSTASQSAQQRPPRPSSTSGVAPVRYPAIGSPTGNPFAPGAGTGSDTVSAPPLPTSAPSWGTGQDAAAPPPSASVNEFETSPSGGHFVQPQPFSSSNTSSPGGQSGAVPGGALEDERDSCVICMAAPVQAGFLHGSSVHKCVCRECAKDLWSSGHRTCPVCRETIQQVILNFY